jgi:hypothetical protein
MADGRKRPIADIWGLGYFCGMIFLTSAIEPEFRKSGWFPGRSVALTQAAPENHPAGSILGAFSGLVVGSTGAGEECASSDIKFGVPPEEDEDIGAWQDLLKTRFVGLGEAHHGHEQLWLDDKERLFSSGLVAPLVVFLGSSFAEGIEKLLRGRRGQPMLLPGQEKVMAWGQWFSAGDTGVIMPAFFGVR